MSKIIIIVFCKFYGRLKEPFNAMGVLTVLLSLNVFTFIGYYKTIVEHSDQIMLPTIYEILIIVLIGITNYAYFLNKKKFEKIFDEYKRNASMSGKKGTWLVLSYIFLTVAMLSSLIWLARMNIPH